MCGRCDSIVVLGCGGTIVAPAYCSNCGWLSVPLKHDKPYAVTMRGRAHYRRDPGTYAFDPKRTRVFSTENKIIEHYTSVSDEDDGIEFDYRTFIPS